LTHWQISKFNYRFAWLLVVVGSCCPALYAQQTDSLFIKKTDSVTVTLPTPLVKKKIIPRQILIRSAIIPGWGQVKMKEYWAIPLIYGGFGVAGYYIKQNSEGYNTFVNAYLAASSMTTSPQQQTVNGRTYQLDQLRVIKNGYRSNLELSYLTVVGIWALQVIEANVSAHLRSFDISEDISLRVKPTFIDLPLGGYVQGVGIVMTIK
jgi:Family of unknown function (DUF5683)